MKTSAFIVLWMATLASEGAVAEGTPSNAAGLAVLGMGRCEEPGLAESVRALRAALSALPGAQILDEAATAEAGGGLPSTSTEEILQTIDLGRSDFLSLNTSRAQAALRAVMPEIDRLPLGPQRWEAYWSARAQLARVLQHLDQRPKATEVLLEILRVQEDFTLSRVEFPPSSRDLLELTRSLMMGLPRFSLKVTSRTQGEQVFLNGFLLGKTPFEKKIVSGTYELVVGDTEHHSLPRKVVLQQDTTIEIDVEREAGFFPALGPCFASDSDRGSRLARLATLGPLIPAERIVAVRLERFGDEDFVAASLVEPVSGQEVREGRVRIERNGSPPSVAELARFILTGEGDGGLVEPVAVELPASRPAPAGETSSGSWQKPAAIGFAALALALGGASVYEHLHAKSLEKDAEALRGADGLLAYQDKPRYDGLLEDAAGARTLRTVLAAGAGVAAVGSGVFFGFALLPGQGNGELALSLSAHGRF